MNFTHLKPFKYYKKKSEIFGINTTINSVSNITKKNGTIAFDNFSIDNPEIPDPTNKLTPSGGVIKPIAKFNTIIIPK